MGRKNFKIKPVKHQPFRLSPARTCQRKKAYHSQQEAEQAINYAQRLNPGNKLKAYYCPDCQKWHLATDQ